jgi:hypothetical protein
MTSPLPSSKSTATTLLVFDSELALSLASSSSTPSPENAAAVAGVGVGVCRFGTVYVGCRRVRPSSRLVQNAAKLQKKNKKKKQEEEGGHEETEEARESSAAAAAAAAATPAPTADPIQKSKRRRRRRRHNDDGGENEQLHLSLSAADDEAGNVHDHPATGDTKLNPVEEGKQTEADCTPEDDDDDDLHDGDGYYTFPNADRIVASSSLVKEEIADLCGEREGVPPVALPYSMMRLLGSTFASTTTTTTTTAGDDRGIVPSRFHAVLDYELSKQWATRLKDSMFLAETLRDQDESIRKMPYVLEPEAWTRKRPDTLLVMSTTVSDATTSDAAASAAPAITTTTASAGLNPLESLLPPRSWFGCQYDTTDLSQETNELVRQQQLQRRREVCDAAVVQLLHLQTHLHVSCGAKFGCDYLLYQGSRNDHHAFAGLRVLVPALSDECGSATTTNEDGAPNDANGDGGTPPCSDPVLERLPLPTPYDMAGYVRGLNTAGKLALLATAVLVGGDDDDADRLSNQEDQGNVTIPTYRVAVVDLALKKVRATTFRGASGTVMPKMLPKRPAAGA